MMVTGSESASGTGARASSATPVPRPKISSKKAVHGNCGHTWATPSRKSESPQMTSDGAQSFMMPASSLGAWRE